MTVQDTSNALDEGVKLFELSNYEEAIKYFDEVIKSGKTDLGVFAWYNKGNSLALLGKYDEAIKTYDEAIKIDPKDANAWLQKGLVFEKLGKYDEAIECFDQVLMLEPNDVGVEKAWQLVTRFLIASY